MARGRKGETQDYLLKTLMDGEIHQVEDMAREHYGDDSLNDITAIRMGIDRLRKLGWEIEAVQQDNSRRKRGYRMRDVSTNWRKAFTLE